MRRAIILATLTLLLMAVAGITVAQEEGFGPDRRFQTEPVAREATVREPIEFVDERLAEENEPAREAVIEGSDEVEADNSEVAEDKAAKAESEGKNRVRPEGVGKPERVGKVTDKGKPPSAAKPGSQGKPEELGEPEGGDRPGGRGKLTSKDKPVGIGKGASARGPIGATKTRRDSEQTHVGRQKITLCHKGKHTIAVGAPAKDAHLRHGDSLGECGL